MPTHGDKFAHLNIQGTNWQPVQLPKPKKLNNPFEKFQGAASTPEPPKPTPSGGKLTWSQRQELAKQRQAEEEATSRAATATAPTSAAPPAPSVGSIASRFGGAPAAASPPPAPRAVPPAPAAPTPPASFGRVGGTAAAGIAGIAAGGGIAAAMADDEPEEEEWEPEPAAVSSLDPTRTSID